MKTSPDKPSLKQDVASVKIETLTPAPLTPGLGLSTILKKAKENISSPISLKTIKSVKDKKETKAKTYKKELPVIQQDDGLKKRYACIEFITYHKGVRTVERSTEIRIDNSSASNERIVHNMCRYICWTSNSGVADKTLAFAVPPSEKQKDINPSRMEWPILTREKKKELKTRLGISKDSAKKIYKNLYVLDCSSLYRFKFNELGVKAYYYLQKKNILETEATTQSQLTLFEKNLEYTNFGKSFCEIVFSSTNPKDWPGSINAL